MTTTFKIKAGASLAFLIIVIYATQRMANVGYVNFITGSIIGTIGYAVVLVTLAATEIYLFSKVPPPASLQTPILLINVALASFIICGPVTKIVSKSTYMTGVVTWFISMVVTAILMIAFDSSMATLKKIWNNASKVEAKRLLKQSSITNGQ